MIHALALLLMAAIPEIYRGKLYGLALALLKNEKLYPSYIIPDKASDWTYKIKGYKKTDELMPVLKFYGDESYLKMNWSEYIGATK